MIMSSMSKDYFLLPFSDYMLFFFLTFSCLIELARTSNAKLNKSGKNAYHCFLPNREKELAFHHLNMMLAIHFS